MAPSQEPITIDSSSGDNADVPKGLNDRSHAGTSDRFSPHANKKPTTEPRPLPKSMVSYYERNSSKPTPARYDERLSSSSVQPPRTQNSPHMSSRSSSSSNVLGLKRKRPPPTSSTPANPIEILSSEDERRMLSAVPLRKDSPNPGTRPSSSLGPAQLLPSSSNGLVMTKRPRQDDPSGIYPAPKKQKNSGLSRPSSHASEAGPPPEGGEERPQSLPRTKGFACKTSLSVPTAKAIKRDKTSAPSLSSNRRPPAGTTRREFEREMERRRIKAAQGNAPPSPHNAVNDDEHLSTDKESASSSTPPPPSSSGRSRVGTTRREFERKMERRRMKAAQESAPSSQGYLASNGDSSGPSGSQSREASREENTTKRRRLNPESEGGASCSTSNQGGNREQGNRSHALADSTDFSASKRPPTPAKKASPHIPSSQISSLGSSIGSRNFSSIPKPPLEMKTGARFSSHHIAAESSSDDENGRELFSTPSEKSSGKTKGPVEQLRSAPSKLRQKTASPVSTARVDSDADKVTFPTTECTDVGDLGAAPPSGEESGGQQPRQSQASSERNTEPSRDSEVPESILGSDSEGRDHHADAEPDTRSANLTKNGRGMTSKASGTPTKQSFTDKTTTGTSKHRQPSEGGDRTRNDSRLLPEMTLANGFLTPDPSKSLSATASRSKSKGPVQRNESRETSKSLSRSNSAQPSKGESHQARGFPLSPSETGTETSDKPGKAPMARTGGVNGTELSANIGHVTLNDKTSHFGTNDLEIDETIFHSEQSGDDAPLARQEGQKGDTNALPNRETVGPQIASPAQREEPSSVASQTFGAKSAAKGTSTASSASQLNIRSHVEEVVAQHVKGLRIDNEYWTRTWLKKARLQSQEQPSPALEEPTDVFSKMTAAQVESTSQKPSSNHGKMISRLTGPKSAKRIQAVPYNVIHSTKEQDVPQYSHFVGIRNNFLANNETTLQHWPYFGDEFDISEAVGLHEYYFVDIAERGEKLHSLALAENLAPHAEKMLEKLGCRWSDVLRFFLDPSPDVGTDPAACHAKSIRDTLSADANELRDAIERGESSQSQSTQRQNPWAKLLWNLPEAQPYKMGKAAVLCERFLNMTKMSLWHVARRSDPVAELLKRRDSPKLTMDGLTCRVCMQFNCQHHGEIREYYDGDENDNSDDGDLSLVRTHSGQSSTSDGRAGPHVVETDIINPPEVNFRVRVEFPESGDPGPKKSLRQRQTLRYWRTGANASLIFAPDMRGPFYPCNHPGTSCRNANCSCFQNQTPCEKTCGCPADCPRKFQGCDCSAQKGRKGLCFEDERCACFQHGRECDPDLCGNCGVREVVDPVSRNDRTSFRYRCRNADIQSGRAKHTILGDSAVHGLGLYCLEHVDEHEFVGEYKGEVIEVGEAERRGAVYEHQNLSYLFSLNQEQEIDSTLFGNRMRFVNHAEKGRYNLYARIFLVNNTHRVGLYAHRPIEPGEELFFDYGPKFPGLDRKGKKSAPTSQTKAAPHVRNPSLVKNFHDVEHDRDELGNRRAVKVTAKQRKQRRQQQKTNKRKPQQQREPSQDSLPDAMDVDTKSSHSLSQEQDSEDIDMIDDDSQEKDLHARGGNKMGRLMNDGDEDFQPDGDDHEMSESESESFESDE